MRIKRVVNSENVCHLWAHQAQSDARNSSNNVFFDGPTIFSYGRHFPMARIVADKSGKNKCVLFTTRKYSVTTSKHLTWTRRAIPDSMPVFTVPFVLTRFTSSAFGVDASEHEANMKYYAAEIESRVAKFERMRNPGQWDIESIQRLTHEANEYSGFFKLRKRFKARLSSDEMYAFVAKRDARRAELDATRDARNAEEIRKAKVRYFPECAARIHVAHAERLARTAKLLAEQAENIAQWRAGAGIYLPYSVPTMLRIEGAEVVTSRGARFPVAHARLGLALVERCRTSGEAYKRNGHTLHLGHYAIDSVDALGNVKAGCHEVSYDEIARLAPMLTA